MKKIFTAFIAVLLVAALLYGYNFYTNGALSEAVTGFIQTETEITEKPSLSAESSSDIKTLSDRIFSRLTAQELEAFDIIYNGISSHKSSVIIYQKLDSDRIFELVNLVLSLHPEIFWFDGSCSFSSSGKLTFNYIYTPSEAKEKNILIEQKAQEVYKKINPKGSEYEKALAVFDCIALDTSYAADELKDTDKYPEISTVEGVFLNGRAVCSGYSKAYQYLLNMAGIDAVTVSGTAKAPDGTEKHAWTALVLDGETYFSDVTWGDAFEGSGIDNSVSHTYFLMNSNEIEKTHTCDAVFSPVSSIAQNNYFINEGVYFEKYSIINVKAKVNECIEEKSPAAELRFSDAEIYGKACKNLFDDGNIYLILKTADPFSNTINTNEVNYSCDDTHNTITIFFEYN